jgi:peptide/nickel transport system substrate-binding protein
MDVAPVARDSVAQGGTVRWAIDTMPATLNVFQADADGSTTRIAGAVLPSLFTLDERGRPQLNPDYLESAKIVDREPKQVVLYKLNQQAVWSNGREIGAPDFLAQWRALRGTETAYWTAHNSGYERIEKIERGADNLEVRVTFNKPYADWKSLFSPLYPQDVTRSAASFNDEARTALKATAGPFTLKTLDRKNKKVVLARNPHWWGERTKLDSLVLTVVPRSGRTAALSQGKLDIAEIDSGTAERISSAGRRNGAGGGQPLTGGPGARITPASALRSWALAHGSDDKNADAEQKARKQTARAIAKYAAEQQGLHGYVVRKSLEPAYTQLALNGESGPLSDERVRRAVARALDRQKLAESVLKPLGLPAKALGSHLAVVGQPAYADSSDALGSQNTQEAQALLADAGWTPGGARKKQAGSKAGSEGEAAAQQEKAAEEKAEEEAAEEAAEEDTAESEEAERKAAERDRKKYEDKKAEERKAREKKAREKKAKEKKSGEGKAGERKSGEHTAGEGKSDEGKSDEGKDEGGSDERTGDASDKESDAPSKAKKDAYVTGDSKPGQAGPPSGTRSHVVAPATAAAFHRAALLLQSEAADESDTKREAVEAAQDRTQAGMAGAYAPRGTAAPAARSGPLGKDGKPLTLRFVLPAGPGSESLRTVGEQISRMLDRVGIDTEISKVADDSFFKDYIASGDYDLALYSWPATAYPATDGRPIFAKPEPAGDGSLLVAQNYTRVGTDHIDQLFDRAVAELDEDQARDLLKQADARIWAAAGSIPLYQRPQLVAARRGLMNAGAFGFAAPRYQDIGFKETRSEASTMN